jgi:hypothetical protein
VTCKPSGPIGQMEKGPQVTHKPSGPTDLMEMEKGPTTTRDTQAVGSHRSDGDGERCHWVPHIR